jgi:hypothetical protein
MSQGIIADLERAQLRSDVPNFKPGDNVRVYAKVVEGGKERVQMFEGVVIARSGSLSRADFTVRKISHQIARSSSTRRASTASRWCAAARCAAPSCTTCAASSARRPASRKTAPRSEAPE